LENSLTNLYKVLTRRNKMAKKALISTVEPRESGYRVAAGLEWVDCADNVVADQFWYDPQDKLIKANPVVVVEAPAAPTKEELLAQLSALQAQITAL
jgi:hypothetical protein